jgi:MFS family permease
MKPPRVTRIELALLAAVLLWAGALRVWHLGQSLFWVDEAESTINALTILAHGYPADHYAGIPIYENTLSRTWPESDEYEFRDSSYSGKGVAVYHGWLPLYSMAASLKAFGIKPDADPGDLRTYTPTVHHDEQYARRLTKAARFPGVVFGSIFLVVIFFAGREIGGRDVGWAALLTAALGERTIAMAREARYYSATVLFGMLACWMIWRMLRKGGWRDAVLGGLVLGLLFHAHSVSFAVAVASLAIGAVVRLFHLDAAGRKRFLAQLCVTGAIVAAFVVPWALLTGFLHNAGDVPKAWRHIKFPEDFILFPLGRPATLVLLGAGLATLLAVDLLRRKLPERFVAPFGGERRAAFYLLVVWMVLGYFAFVFGMPAASFVSGRMTLPMLGPGIVLAAMMCSAVAQVAMGMRSRIAGTFAAPAMLLAFLAATGGLVYTTKGLRLPDRGNALYVINHLRNFPFRPGTRVYTTPNKHLVLTVYSGMPVQAISPVRKSFLDHYDRDILVLEGEPLYEPPRPERVQAAAKAAGLAPLPKEKTWDLSWAVMYKSVVDRTAAEVPDTHPRPQEITLPDYLRPVAAESESHTARWMADQVAPVQKFPAMFRGYEREVRNHLDWWPVYFYRFVNPPSRMHANLNYHERVSRGTAWVLPIGWRVFYSPGTEQGPISAERNNELAKWWTPLSPAQDTRLSQVAITDGQ